MRECEWNKLKRRCNIPSSDLLKWRNQTFTHDEMLKMIRNGDFFGLCQVSIEFPEKFRTKWRGINFPPIFNRISLTEDQISSEMIDSLRRKKTKFPLHPQLMLTFSAKEYICPTTMIRFYLEEGANIEIDWGIAYSKGQPLRDFITGQTEARIAADREGKKMKSKLHKDIRLVFNPHQF